MIRRVLFAVALLISLAVAGLVSAQATTHSVTLSWTDTLNPAIGTTYTVLRATGLCSGTPSFSTLATGITVKTYTDSTVAPGNYCYEVEAVVGGVSSAPSNTVQPPVPAFAPSGLSFTVS